MTWSLIQITTFFFVVEIKSVPLLPRILVCRFNVLSYLSTKVITTFPHSRNLQLTVFRFPGPNHIWQTDSLRNLLADDSSHIERFYCACTSIISVLFGVLSVNIFLTNSITKIVLQNQLLESKSQLLDFMTSQLYIHSKYTLHPNHSLI